MLCLATMLPPPHQVAAAACWLLLQQTQRQGGPAVHTLQQAQVALQVLGMTWRPRMWRRLGVAAAMCSRRMLLRAREGEVFI